MAEVQTQDREIRVRTQPERRSNVSYDLDDAMAVYYIARSQGGGRVDQLSSDGWEQVDGMRFLWRDADGTVVIKIKFIDGEGNALDTDRNRPSHGAIPRMGQQTAYVRAVFAN
jgi:hypothetical protein